MTGQPHNFNHNGIENIWCKFQLWAPFPLRTTQNSVEAKNESDFFCLSGGKPKSPKMYIGSKVIVIYP